MSKWKQRTEICTCDEKYNQRRCQIAHRGRGDVKSLCFPRDDEVEKKKKRDGHITAMRFRLSSAVSKKATSGLRRRSTEFNSAKRHKMKWRLHFGHTWEIWKMHEAPGEQPPTSLPTASPAAISTKTSLFIISLYLFPFFCSFTVLFCVQIIFKESFFARLSLKSVCSTYQSVVTCRTHLFVCTGADLHLHSWHRETCDALKTPTLKYRKLHDEVF